MYLMQFIQEKIILMKILGLEYLEINLTLIKFQKIYVLTRLIKFLTQKIKYF
jgi:hypothetical protein